jgi:hypothetical protein
MIDRNADVFSRDDEDIGEAEFEHTMLQLIKELKCIHLNFLTYTFQCFHKYSFYL